MSYLYILIGFIIGWLTKIPFLIKWYRELQETKDYKLMMLNKKMEEYERSKINP